MDALLTFLTANATPLFVVAVGATVAGYLVRNGGSLRAVRAVAIVSLCACLPLTVLYGLAALLGADAMSLVLAALWAWNSWTAWVTWKNTRPPKPPVRRN